MKVFPWLKMRKKTERELPYEPPIWFGPKSNGEFFTPQTPRDRRIRKLVLERAAENANRLGMDRRQFLASAMGMATTLLVINEATGCSSSSTGGKPGPLTGSGGAGAADAGLCKVPYQAQFEQACADAAIGGNEFIFDVQTHWFNKADLANFSAYQNAFGPLFNIATEDAYINGMFCNSDTTMTCLTAWPGVSCTGTRKIGCGFPLSNDHIVASRDKINALAGDSQRVVNHVQILPQDPSGIEVQLAIMEEFFCKFGAGAWKLYPGFKPGFRFDDADAGGLKVVDKGMELGVKRFCIHKGLPIGTFFDPVTNYPDDIGPVAAKYPDASFIIYHSAICAGTDPCTSVEGPYDAVSARPTGVDALIRSCLDHGIKPGGNVYGETGTSFNNLIPYPDQAAHFFGKLLKYLGEDNVVWGTDCVISGSPQPQIEAFRALTIPQAMQDQYGYPALTDAIKAKIFGLNSAKLYGVDVTAQRCKVNTCQLTELKQQMDDELGPRRWAFEPPKGPQTYDEFWEGAEEMRKTGRPG